MPIEGNWLQQAMKDNEGDYDVAYVALFGVALAVFLTLPFLCIMSMISYFRCVPIIKDGITPIICNFDPQPLGIAIGAVCGGFATALASLAGYMAATRNRDRERPNG
jgi:hypothetical protein